ncbi:ATP-binding cassette domain-containing protein, partial [Escherichia coli]|nr:ATP-binding cassette domain-containing protein [Escherichia coli]
NPVFTIGDQIAEVLILHEGMSKQAALAEAKRLLDTVRLPDAADLLGRYPHQLSGGMRQRVMIARALAINPDILLMDEAFSALDPLIRTEMQDELTKLQARHQRTVVFISHDLDE